MICIENLIFLLPGVVFTLGAVGIVIQQKNLLVVLICLELMLAGAILSFSLASIACGTLNGFIFALFILVIAAAETAVGLSLYLAYASDSDSFQKHGRTRGRG